MPDIVPDYTGPQKIEIDQPLEVAMTEKKTREFVAECAMRLFCSINYDVNTKKMRDVADECVKRAVMLAKVLREEGFLSD